MRKVLVASALAAVYLAGCSMLPGVKQYDALEDGPGRIMQPSDDAGQGEPFSELGNKSPYSVNGRFYYVMEDPTHYRARGKASWYGNKFHGRKTSSGEDFDMYAMTAAHRNLPLPTYLEVTNLDNGKVAIVKVNDRGPYVDDRLLDLSYAAAVKLGMMEKGNAPVEVRAVTGNDIADARRQIEEDGAAARVQAGSANDALPATDLQPVIEVASVAGAAEDVSNETVKTATEVANASAAAVSENTENVAQAAEDAVEVVTEVAPAEPTLAVSETPTATATPAADTISGRDLALQLGAFSKIDGAIATMDQAQALVPAIPAFVLRGESNGKSIYRVRVGPVNTKELIDEASLALAKGGITDSRVLPMQGGGDCVAGCR